MWKGGSYSGNGVLGLPGDGQEGVNHKVLDEANRDVHLSEEEIREKINV